MENDSSSAAVIDTGNSLTGNDAKTATAWTTSSLSETGSDGSGGSFALNKSVTDSNSQTAVANDLTGSFSSTATETNTSLASEITTDTVSNTTTGTSFTETITNVSTTQDTGNTITGDYTSTVAGTITTTDADSYSKVVTISPLAQNSLTSAVTESSSETSGSVETGNSISGAYTTSATGTRTYSLNDSETDDSLTTVVSGGIATVTTTLLENSALYETGTLASTTNETGNTVDGSYSRTIAGTDAYSMTETGTNSGNAFSEVVTGTDTVTLTETGNPVADTFGRSIVGTGTYNRTDAGAGATLSNVTGGAISYSLAETGDALGAVFSQALTGTDRYGLLEHFTDVSNTNSGNSPGNMNFYPFGQPFVDPGASSAMIISLVTPLQIQRQPPRPVTPQPNATGQADALRASIASSIAATAQLNSAIGRESGDRAALIRRRNVSATLSKRPTFAP